MKKLGFLFVVLSGVMLLQSCDTKREKEYTGKTSIDVNGLEFIKGVHESGLKEIAASTIAKEKSTNKQITDFASMMITDHTNAAKAVDSVGDDRRIYLKDALTLDDKNLIDSLSKKSGAEFDKAYMEMMVEDHKDAVELFENNKDSNFEDIRAIVKNTLPKIEKHYESAKAINSSLGGK